MNVAGGPSLPSVSFSGSYDVVDDMDVAQSFPAQASPRLGSILGKYIPARNMCTTFVNSVEVDDLTSR